MSQHEPPRLLPAPLKVQPLPGSWQLDALTPVSAPQQAQVVVDLLREYLPIGGHAPEREGIKAAVGIRFDLQGTDLPPGPEAYGLDIDSRGITMRARTTTGLRHAVQTLRQLATGQRERAIGAGGRAWVVAGVSITDAPRLGWRGSLLDVGRWYLPLDYLHAYVDMLALHKMNRFHLHLTEDQGWRMEITSYPLLTEIGAWRARSQLGHEHEGRHDNIPHGGFYTQAQLRELVAFAARRGVEVVPEINLPGHSSAAIAAYPWLGNPAADGITDPKPEVSTSWGVHTSVLNVEEPTLRFATEVWDEALEIFDSPWVHIGGDECPTQEWFASPAARNRSRILDAVGPQRLQDVYTDRIGGYLLARGRRPIVWDEAATEQCDRSVVVMAWTDEDAGLAATARGHDVVMSPQQKTYLDHHQSQAPGRPMAHEGLTSLRDAYGYDAGVPQAEESMRARVLGVQGQTWTEYTPTPAHIDALIFPRLCAIAERAWLPGPPDYDDFAGRLPTHLRRLSDLGFAIALRRLW